VLTLLTLTWKITVWLPRLAQARQWQDVARGGQVRADAADAVFPFFTGGEGAVEVSSGQDAYKRSRGTIPTGGRLRREFGVAPMK
jgi:hypothetical protein